MKTSFHRILTEDHIELVGLLYGPEQKTEKILVHVHGMAGNFYENLFLDYIAKTLTEAGISFFAFNNRGCEYIKDLSKIVDGKKEFVRIGDSYEIFEESAFDIKAAIDFVEAKGFSQIHLSGHSLGSPKVASYSARAKDNRIASVIFMSPADMVGLIQQDEQYQRDIAIAEKMVAEDKGGELLPFPVLWDKVPLSAKTYISLGTKNSPVAIFNFHDSEDALPVLSEINIPLFTVMGKMDDAAVISVEETMERIKKAATQSPKVHTHILGDADHGYNGYEQQLADTLCAWLKAV